MRIKVLMENEFQTVLVSAAQQRWCTQSAKRSSSCTAVREIEMMECASESAEKPCLFWHNFNKLQQVKLSAVWILAISLTILVYKHY